MLPRLDALDGRQGPGRRPGAECPAARRWRRQRELTERRAFIETFVKEIVVMPGDALLRYTIPMPDDSQIPGRNAEEMALNGSVLSTVKISPPFLTVDRTVFEMWLGAL